MIEIVYNFLRHFSFFFVFFFFIFAKVSWDLFIPFRKNNKWDLSIFGRMPLILKECTAKNDDEDDDDANNSNNKQPHRKHSFPKLRKLHIEIYLWILFTKENQTKYYTWRVIIKFSIRLIDTRDQTRQGVRERARLK